jgi:hypothetical protein
MLQGKFTVLYWLSQPGFIEDVKFHTVHSIIRRIGQCLAKYCYSQSWRWGWQTLRHVIPKWNTERFPWHRAFVAIYFFLFLLPYQNVYVVKNMCIYTHTWLCTLVYGFIYLFISHVCTFHRSYRQRLFQILEQSRIKVRVSVMEVNIKILIAKQY